MTYTIAALEAELPSPEMNDLVTEILASSLKSIGLVGGGAREITDLALDKQPASYYERWLSSSIRYLQEQGFLAGDRTVTRDVRPLAELWNEWGAKVSAWAANPNQQSQGALLKACLDGLPAVLSGRQRATDVLFPNSSMHLVEGLYRGNPQADYFNEILGETLSVCIDLLLAADPERRIRVVEIGAGTGGTTAVLLPILSRYPVEEYCYTDISRAFLMHGERNFKTQFPAMTTAIFDVSKPLESQSIEANHYDFVIAANVLHATPNIRETLRNAKALLKNQGVLLLNEIAGWTLFNHLTFGLLEGWWLYEDAAVRLPGSPGLSPDKWREVLAEEGFESVILPGADAQKFGQQIVGAVSDGWTRQRIVTHPPSENSIARKQTTVEEADSAATQSGRAVTRSSPEAELTQMGVDYTRRIVAAKLSEALRMDVTAIRHDASFADYGVDSIVGVNLVRTISEALQIEIETTSLFEFSTVEDLSGHIMETWREKIIAQVAPLRRASEVRARTTEGRVPIEVGTQSRHQFTGTTRFSNGHTASRLDDETESAESAPAPIAIIGMSGRFAESESLDAFWQHLARGDDLVKLVSRWKPEDCVTSAAMGHGYCSHGSFVESIDQFDPGFFGISPLEATYMDPQQRLFLEESWKALEDAGYGGKSVGERQCAVYVGCGSSHYDVLAGKETPPQAFWGNSQAVTPARIAYSLNLQGPAIAIDTACSSSLVAIHLACQGLWARETEMALAGGVFLQPTPGFYHVANRAGMLSPDGKCYSFDARANGFVPGEGVGVVVLKRLRDALADSDHIHGVIAGSGVNQDGKSNGLIAPNGRAQERLERTVYDRFKINPETIQVVEAHGTGTSLGDSIEYGAITRAFREHTDKKQFCALGTVKTNIGHTSTAAGVAGVLKLLLSLKHRQIPPSLHFEERNPSIDLESGPFYVNAQLREWVVDEGEVRRAAISSFGFSGTNAHLILEEAPAVEHAAVEAPASLVVLSARTAEQLKQHAQNLLTHLERTPSLSMADLSFSLFVGRMHFTHRLASIARDTNELSGLLQQWLETGAASQVYASELHEGKAREQVSLKKFGNYCIQECREATDATSYLENLAAIAELYIQGYSLDFPALFSGDAKRIPLPTYPFAREHYWVDTVPPARTSTAIARAILAAEPRIETPGRPKQSQASTFNVPGGDPHASVRDELSHMASALLHIPVLDISPDRMLMDLGFDSVGLTDFSKAINENFEVDITPVLFFDYPSISDVAKYLAAEGGKEIRRVNPRTAPAHLVAEPADPHSPALPRAARTFSVEHRFVNESIAIVGIAGVMPQSEDLDALWANLRDARDLVTVIPGDRWNWEEYYGDPLREVNKSNSKWGGFMNEVDKFDPLFFGISPKEAQMMDPQQRIFLETVWKAIEDSGQRVSDLAGTRTGLFVGVGSNDYLDLMRHQGAVLDAYTASGNAHSVLANRVSYLLNLHGPSAPIDTACSSSLVALHRAVESIHTRSSDMAIVGGVQIILSPGGYISFGMAGMLSSDGKCRTFDKQANGYVRGEGCGAMLLKPLAAAEGDGNHIYAVIKATSENHGGRVTTMIAPNSAAQAALLVEAYEKAQIDPATVGYIECHGTGTALGDPIEVQALSAAFSELYKRYDHGPVQRPHCGLGTIKTNIGHLETAAGIAGLFKVLLALKHKQIPGNVHFQELNPYIRLEGTPFYVVDRLTPWEPVRDESGSTLPRRAGVSSFGFGGANAHAVLEEYIPPERVSVVSVRDPQLIVLSAKNQDRLRAYVQSMRTYLSGHEVQLPDLAYTLQVGRDEMPERVAFVVSGTDELGRQLGQFLTTERVEGCFRATATNRSNGEGASVHDAIERKDLSEVAELWVSGAAIDWGLLHNVGVPRRVSAPTYPFARDRYWIRGAPALPPKEPVTTLQTFGPVWNPVIVELGKRLTVSDSSNVILLGSDDVQLEWVRKAYPNAESMDAHKLGKRTFDQLLWIAPESGPGEAITDQQEKGVLAVFRIVKALLQSGYAKGNLCWTVVTTKTQQVMEHETFQPAHAGIAGFIGSLAKEFPNWSLRLLDVDSLEAVTAQDCLSLPWDKQGNGLVHRGGQWFQQELELLTAMPQTTSAYRRNGVYVVIGGAGGIGEVWSRFMIENYQANVVWVGRRPFDAAIEKKVKSLNRLGLQPLYISADATNPDALALARDTILEIYPAIHGVVHSALVLHDQSVAGMTESVFRSSLAAKVDITVNLDRVFGRDELDFLLFFSSIVSFLRPAGQSNYSAGCMFKDSFARMLQQQRPYPVKVMNWGYWGSVGVASDESHRQRMARVGLGSIEPQEGMTALQALMSSETPQIALIKTIEKGTAAAIQTTRRASDAGGVVGRTIGDHVRLTIIAELCEELGIDSAVVRSDAPLSDYGVDSIAGVNLVRALNEVLQIQLEPSSLFDYKTVDQLSEYIVENWRDQISAQVVPLLPVTAVSAGNGFEQSNIGMMSEMNSAELLDEVLWQEALPADSYELLTF